MLNRAQNYLDSKFPVEGNVEDVAGILDKTWRDPCSHAIFAEMIRKVGYLTEILTTLIFVEIYQRCNIFGCRVFELLMQGLVYT